MRGGWIVRAKPVGRAEWGYGPSAFSVQMTDRWRPFFPRDPRRQAPAIGRVLRYQPELPARRHPAGWLSRPHVRRRARLADDLEGLGRPYEPRRRIRTRPSYHLTQVKCG